MLDGVESNWIEQAGKQWDIVLRGVAPEYKIHAIKMIRGIGPYGIAEGKGVVESLPHVLLIAAPRYEAEVTRQHLLVFNPLAKMQVHIRSSMTEREELLRKARKHGFMPARWFPSMLDHLPRLRKRPDF